MCRLLFIASLMSVLAGQAGAQSATLAPRLHHVGLNSVDPEPAIAKARATGMRAGVTLNLETPVEAAFPYLEEIDDLMLMSIRPGWSGQELNPDVYPRIEAARDEVDRRGLEVDIEIDGGVKVENAQRAVDAGATVLVSASGIYRAPDKVEAARALAEIAARGRTTQPASDGTR